MGTLSTLLALCGRNPPVTTGIHSQNNTELLSVPNIGCNVNPAYAYFFTRYFNGLVQERRNPSALTMESRFSWINPPICYYLMYIKTHGTIIAPLQFRFTPVSSCALSWYWCVTVIPVAVPYHESSVMLLDMARIIPSFDILEWYETDTWNHYNVWQDWGIVNWCTNPRRCCVTVVHQHVVSN